MRIGILNGGGDCPGLNAVIRAVVLTADLRHGDEVIGYLDGWKGVLDDEHVRARRAERCRDILTLGGTILGTSRTNPFTIDGGPERVLRQPAPPAASTRWWRWAARTPWAWRSGSGTTACASSACPKTIDNDLSGTEVTFGFDTAVQIATDAIDRLRTTAESHHRVIVCEVMGRHVGWIATHAGIAGGAAEILVPEVPFDVDAVCERLQRRHRGGQFSSIVVISEGAVPVEGPDAESARLATSGAPVDQFGHARLGGIGAWLAEELERRTGFEARTTILGPHPTRRARRRPSTGSWPPASAWPRWRPSTTGPSG